MTICPKWSIKAIGSTDILIFNPEWPILGRQFENSELWDHVDILREKSWKRLRIQVEKHDYQEVRIFKNLVCSRTWVLKSRSSVTIFNRQKRVDRLGSNFRSMDGYCFTIRSATPWSTHSLDLKTIYSMLLFVPNDM